MPFGTSKLLLKEFTIYVQDAKLQSNAGTHNRNGIRSEKRWHVQSNRNSDRPLSEKTTQGKTRGSLQKMRQKLQGR